jgi:hypothetical protein
MSRDARRISPNPRAVNPVPESGGNETKKPDSPDRRRLEEYVKENKKK